jgi:dTDP-L-rhamnose 4-epimerase
MLRAWTAARGSALSVLRLQNVYGPGQSLTNPYTGIVSLFGRMARARQKLEVYEDGRILRDFVFIDDAVEALAAAVSRPPPQPRFVDIGSGIATTIHDLARRLANLCDAPEPMVVGKFRDGDVRAASCDIEPTASELGWQPQWSLDRGLPMLLNWIEEQHGLPV